MAFSIPPKSFLSFGLNQVSDTFLRILQQMENSRANDSEQNKMALNSYLEVLSTHSSQRVRDLGHRLNSLSRNDHWDLHKMAMEIERYMGLDIAEDNFLVSTEDSQTVKKNQTKEVHVILDNLRSSFNVGSLFRSCEAFGATQLHLCGYTPTPENSKTAKSALGTDSWVMWRYWESTPESIEYLKGRGVKIYAFETSQKSKELSLVKPQFPAAILLGNERYGLATHILETVDELIEIPLLGRKNSLNVSVCGAIALQNFISQ